MDTIEIDINPGDIEADNSSADVSFIRPAKPAQTTPVESTNKSSKQEVDIPESDIEVDIPESDISITDSEDISGPSMFEPRANLNETYINEKANVAERLKKEYDRDTAINNQIDTYLTKQRYTHRKSRARAETGELEETNSLMGFFTGSGHKVESVSRKWNQLSKAGMKDVDIKKHLSDLGVSDLDLRKTMRYRAGTTDEADTFIEDAIEGINMMKDIGGEISKFGGDILNGLGASANGIADAISTVHPLNMAYNMTQGRMPWDRSKMVQDYFDKKRAHYDAFTEERKRQNFGAGQFGDFAGRYAFDAATMAYTPTRLGAIALSAGVLSMPTSAMQGYDTAQVVAISTLTALTLGAIVSIAKYAPRMIGKKPIEMDSETRKVWNAVKAKTGLSDAEMQEMLKAYTKEFKVEGVDPDTVASNYLMHVISNKHLAKVGHQGKASNVYEQTLLNNPKIVQEVKKAFTNRAKELDRIHAKSDLGKLVKKNRKGTEEDGIAVNWRQLKEDILNQSRNSEGKFDLQSPLIKRIFKYADMYDSNDLAAQAMLKDVKASNLTLGEEVEDLVVQGAKAVATKKLAQATGANVINRYSVFARGVDLVTKYIPRMQDSKAIQNFVIKQLSTGTPLEPKLLADDLRRFQAVATMSDKEVDDLVEQLVTISQETDISARRAKLKEQLGDLKKANEEYNLAKAEASNEVEFAKVQLDEAIAVGDKGEIKAARRALYEAQVNQRKVIAESNKEININKDLALKLKSSALPSVPKEGMNTILKRIDPVMHGKAGPEQPVHNSIMEAGIEKPKETPSVKEVVPESKPFNAKEHLDILRNRKKVTKEVVSSETAHTVSNEQATRLRKLADKAAQNKSEASQRLAEQYRRQADALEQSSSNEVKKLDDPFGTQEHRDVLRELRTKHGSEVFGKDFMDEFSALDEEIKAEGKKGALFSKFINGKLETGEITQEQVLEYYLKNASIGTKTDLENALISGKAGISKPTIQALNEAGISNEQIVKYMQRKGIITNKVVETLGSFSAGVVGEGVAQKDINGDGKYDIKDVLIAGIGAGIVGNRIFGKMAKKTEAIRATTHIVPIEKALIKSDIGSFFYGNKAVNYKVNNGIVEVDISDFDSGSGLGRRFYNDLFTTLDKLGLKYRPSSLSNVNKIKMPINLFDYYKSTGQVLHEDGVKGMEKALNKAITYIDDVLELKGLPSLDKLSPAQLDKAGSILGSIDSIRTGARSLKLLQEAKAMRDGAFGRKGMIDTTIFRLPDSSKSNLREALNKGAKYGDYSYITRLDKNTRQDIVDELFNSRSLKEDEWPLGMTGNQSKNDVNYFGFTTKMNPEKFLQLARNRNRYSLSEPMSDVRKLDKSSSFAYDIAKSYSGGSNKPIKLGPPKLWGNIKDGKIIITGHEGRHRSDAVLELLGNDVHMPVDIQLRNDGEELRRRGITQDMLDMKLVSEDEKPLGVSLRDLLPKGFDTSKL